MKYVKPEMEVVEFENDNVITQVSVVTGDTVDVPSVTVPKEPF